MADIWVLVADSGEARIYAARHMRADLTLVETLTHAIARAHPRDLVSDAPGRVHDRMGAARHSVDAGQQMKIEERSRFAREIAGRLDDAHRLKKFGRLVVMAGPAFLGVLRESFGKAVSESIVAEIPKDLVAQDESAIQAHLP
jgi:protein required for attachment to host cells